MGNKRSLIFILTTLISCTYSDKGDVVDKERLTGRYVYQANNQDTIDVNSNGTYTNYTWWHGRKLQNSGTWIYDSLNGRIDFDNFSFLLDTMNIGDSTFLPRGHWNTKIESEEREVRLIYTTDISKGYFLNIDSIDSIKID
jgi:hypothetical protein